jgi:pimeloyl-ACP methyl ester carboxylesterase
MPVLARWAEVLVPDLPGHGDSAVTVAVAPTVEGFAHALVEQIEPVRAGRPVILVGHSMGGAVALEAARHLDSVRAVVLVDTFVIPYGDLSEDTARSIERPFQEDFATAMQNLLDTSLHRDAPPALHAQLQQDCRHIDPIWALSLWSDLLRWQPQSALEHSSGRMFAINGSPIPESARRRLAPHCTEHVLPHARHFPQLEQPQAFNDLLVSMIEPLHDA